MHYAEIMNEALNIAGERNDTYGNIRPCMERAAVIASTICGVQITPHEIALILHAVKLARLDDDRGNKDHYVDGINYLAFAGMLLEPVPNQGSDP
jgi:hypothetical protein